MIEFNRWRPPDLRDLVMAISDEDAAAIRRLVLDLHSYDNLFELGDEERNARLREEILTALLHAYEST